MIAGCLLLLVALSAVPFSEATDGKIVHKSPEPTVDPFFIPNPEPTTVSSDDKLRALRSQLADAERKVQSVRDELKDAQRKVKVHKRRRRHSEEQYYSLQKYAYVILALMPFCVYIAWKLVRQAFDGVVPPGRPSEAMSDQGLQWSYIWHPSSGPELVPLLSVPRDHTPGAVPLPAYTAALPHMQSQAGNPGTSSPGPGTPLQLHRQLTPVLVPALSSHRQMGTPLPYYLAQPLPLHNHQVPTESDENTAKTDR